MPKLLNICTKMAASDTLLEMLNHIEQILAVANTATNTTPSSETPREALKRYLKQILAKKRMFEVQCQLCFDYTHDTDLTWLREFVNALRGKVGLDQIPDDCGAEEIKELFRTTASVAYDTFWDGNTDVLNKMEHLMSILVTITQIKRGETTKADQNAAIAAAEAKIPETRLPKDILALFERLAPPEKDVAQG